MVTLDSHGQLKWYTYGPNKFSGPYAIEFGYPNEAAFGSKSASKSGSQAQLKAFYTSRAVWLTLKSLGRNAFDDRKEAETIVHTVARVASREINKGEFEVDRYNKSVLDKSLSALAALHRKAVSPRATPVSSYPALNWRRAASGRLDAFTDRGSYHITHSHEGYEVRWLYQAHGLLLGTFGREDLAKQVAEKHAASHAAAEESPRRRRARR
jgi:hypothetical protein